MGGAGDLLSLALSVPPWEELHELSPAELRLTNLVTTDAVAEVFSPNESSPVASVADVSVKTVQDRFVSSTADDDTMPRVTRSTKTAEAIVPTGGVAAAA